MRRHLAPAALLTALAACATTVQPGDTAGPGVTISDLEGDLRLVSIEEGGTAATGRTCEGEGSVVPEVYTEEMGFQNRGGPIYEAMTPAKGRTELLVAFGDASGIRSATVDLVERIAVVEPADLERTTETFRRGSGTSRTNVYRTYTFLEEDGLAGAHLATFTVAIPRDPGFIPFSANIVRLTAVDGAGNRSERTVLLKRSDDC